MAFNAYTYRANKEERQAREYLAIAREQKRDGEAYPGRVASLVKLARLTWRVARGWRSLRDEAPR